jgi:serine/threonine protein kinase
VKLLDVVHGTDGTKLYLILEYFNIDLKRYLDKKGTPMSLSQVKDVMW